MRRGHLSVKALKAWAELNGVELHGVTVRHLHNGQGAGIVATKDVSEEGTIFVRVPKDLVLSKDLVWEYALADSSLRSVLEAMGEWAQTAQGAIILFLLVQITASSPDVTERIGLPNPFTAYVQFLPDESGLPSRWSEEELQCLWGTSLRNHMAVKLHSLQTIFADLRENTKSIPWCAKCWWDETTGGLTLDDFKIADSMFRSRAMDFGDQGQSLVPFLDMANHDRAEQNVALYEIERTDGSAMLMLQDERHVLRGYEVTINYGGDRSASDLLHAYGFLEDMPHAGSMFVSFPPDFAPFETDPLKAAKFVALKLVPGVKFYVSPEGRVKFHSPFVYAMSVNEEDGLSWDVARTVQGETEFQFFIQGVAVDTADDLVERLQEHVLWDLFQWRAHAYLSILVDGILNEIKALEDRPLSEQLPEGVTATSHAWKVARKLRLLEWKLLRMVQDDFRHRLGHLENSETVMLWNSGELGPDGMRSSKEEKIGSGKDIIDEDSGVTEGAEYVPTGEQHAAAEDEWEIVGEEVDLCPIFSGQAESLTRDDEHAEAAMSKLSLTNNSGPDTMPANVLRTSSAASSGAMRDDDTSQRQSEEKEAQISLQDDSAPAQPRACPSSPRSTYPSSFDGHASPPQASASKSANVSSLSQQDREPGPLRYLGRMHFDLADRRLRAATQLTEETHRAMEARSDEEDDFS